MTFGNMDLADTGIEPLLTVKDMAKLLRRSVRWVYGNADTLPGVTRDFGGVRFDPRAVRDRLQHGSKGLSFSLRQR